WLSEFGTIEGIVANVDRLKGKLADKFRDPEQLALLEMSRQLVSLRDDVEVPELDSFARKEWHLEELTKLFTELEFSAILSRLAATFTPEPETYTTVLASAELEGYVAGAAELTLTPLVAGAQVGGVAGRAPGRPPASGPAPHRYRGAPVQLPASTVVARLAPPLASADVKKTIHDVKQARLALGVPIEGPIVDPMLAGYLLD